MLEDRYGNRLSTNSQTARDAYVEACDLQFAFWPGGQEAFSRATLADPNFALAHLGTAQFAAMAGDVPALQTALAAANAVAALTEREASQRRFFGLMLSAQPDAASVAARDHLLKWPRDGVVMHNYATILGVVGAALGPDLKVRQAALMDELAPHYGDDWAFLGQYSMMLSEVGRRIEARDFAEQSLAAFPRNALAAHSRGHVAYEDDEADEGRQFLSDYLATYPREGLLHGHLAWHLAIDELAAGNTAKAFSVFEDAIAPGRHLGPARIRVYDPIQFLWRAELAGCPRETKRWQEAADQAHRVLPKAGAPFVDWQIVLADAVTGNTASMAERLAQMQSLHEAGKYPSGGVVPAVARGMAAYGRGSLEEALNILVPLMPQFERAGGSRAQEDLIEFTVYKAHVELGRTQELGRLLAERRSGPGKVPVAELA